MSTTPQCPICHDSGKTIHVDGQQSAYLDCSCQAATARRELNEAVGAFAIINRDNMDCDWFIHQRAKALGRAEALAELHPLWLAEKERAERAEARIAELEAKLAEVPRWISVDERLPDMSSLVWLFDKHIGSFIGERGDTGEGWLWGRAENYYQDKHGDWQSRDCEQDDFEVTYWMPLPTLPAAPAPSEVL